MSSSRKPTSVDWGTKSSASIRSLSLAGLMLLAFYGSILVSSLIPIQLLVPVWQLKVGSALINAAPFPLIGLGLLHLTAVLDPQDSLLIRRRRIAAQLAGAAALGFLLLVPLLSLAAVDQQQQQHVSQQSLISQAESNLQTLRQVVDSAKSSRELHDRLIVLNGPVLNDSDQLQTLPTIKARVNGFLDQTASQVSHQRQQLPPSNPWQLLPELLRNAFTSLALAIGFAGLARRGRSKQSLLAELEQAGKRLSQRRGSGQKSGNRKY